MAEKVREIMASPLQSRAQAWELLNAVWPEGDLEAVRRHLDSGVSVDLQNEYGLTALMRAVDKDKKDARSSPYRSR